MKQSDLKDGMVLTTRDGATYLKLTNNYLYSFKQNALSELTLYSYNDDLTHELLTPMDIMLVTYMREVVWQRREFFSLLDALQNKSVDQIIKHKDCPMNAGKAATIDNIIQAYRAWLCKHGMSVQEANIKCIHEIQNKSWELV